MPQKAFDLLSTLGGSLAPETLRLFTAIVDKARELNSPIYLVGGPVRDLLLGTTLKDLDMAVEADGPDLARELSLELGGQVVVHPRFRTATLKVAGQRFDVATARQEHYTRPGALPKVAASTIHQDLARRDFSINAMAIPLSGPHQGRVLDPLGGQRDLAAGHVRVLHSRSFIDDATRILRAVRYEQRLGFQLEGETSARLRDAVHREMLATLSGDRIRREMEIMFDEPRPHLPLMRLGELGALRAIFPAWGDGSWLGPLAADEHARQPMVYLAALSHLLSQEEGEALISRLRFPGRWAGVVRDSIAIRLMLDEGGSDWLEPGAPSPQLCRDLDQRSSASVEAAALMSRSPEARGSLDTYLSRLRHTRTALTGRDLARLGIGEGPLVGLVLRALKDARLEGRVSSRSEELELARTYVGCEGRLAL